MKDLIARVAGGPLSSEEISEAVASLLSGRISDAGKADFLEALNARGEHPRELRSFAEAFLAQAVPFKVPPEIGPVLDVCGTGGDRQGFFNISTCVMLVAAGAGVRVVKHGNRGVTSRSGGADVLEALGVPAELPAEKLVTMLVECGACFLFAPRFHPSFKAVAGARRDLAARGKTSVFNMLGPLLNPARPEFQLTGVYAEGLLDLYTSVLPSLGRRTVWVVHGRARNGTVDEISTAGPTTISEVRDGIRSVIREISPGEFVPAPASTDLLRGGDAAVNAQILLALLAGEKSARRDIVVLNAAAALQVAGLAAGWGEGVEMAGESIDSGAAMRTLEAMRRIASGA